MIRRRPLTGLLAAVTVSLTGSTVAALALPWFVWSTTGSATRMGVVAFAEATPYVLVKALGGPFVDRYGPRRISWVSDLASAAAMAAVPVLHALGVLSFGVLLGLVALIGAARGPGDTAKEVMVPEAARRGAVPLERATGLLGGVERLSGTLGPVAGGALVALAGEMAALGVNAALFVLGSLLVAGALPRGMGGAAPASDGGYLRRLGEGLALLRGDPLLLTLVVMLAVTNLLDAATMVLVPLWVYGAGHSPAALGTLLAVWSGAALAGSLLAAGVAHRLPRRVVFFAGFVLGSVPKYLVLLLDAPLWAVAGVFVVGGFGVGFVNPVIGAVMFERIPGPLLGRAQALGGALSFAGIPLGRLLGGAGAGLLGLAPVLALVGLVYAATIAVSGLRPEWRSMDRGQEREREKIPGVPAEIT
ncbi:putative multidrug-efflux transporter [Streptomyces sp. RB5]|uniref:Multidrug efflux pump Tap n=1 Tax=Streptomyces smaragdinus TaxID=2585196 RepID=A0A7K0CK84_9ACTN|nr:MFS transporter [Streptomyces smaragdinus]MQY13184.1 putative multidrug-efflux transporter [Streptomyces smaragdinus]